ncbi:RNA polymerase sigma factor (sigma-70 family) [Larkinella arboricola]|uniref:RNA polymerase sigma factor (Sigma-70 family) n=1 Tax=Larkinella arboricola TaxID=643671 RepID=A0A327X1C0_LARAB|nr:sigma-70 family RNA polymerase sigma factor [Larkinella arboricola]RAJ96009.1 RNA polymerase sigma factor (sigma-70 family) [Larkinella arboricola]
MKQVTLNSALSRELHWWHQLRKSNIVAFKGLVSDYSPLLFSFGTQYTTDADLVKNCIQKLFLEVWDNRDSLTAPAGMKAWLFGSLRQRILHSPKIRQGALESATNPAHFFIEFTLDTGLTQDKTTRGVADTLKRLIEQLPQCQQEVVYLKFFQELNSDQIAHVTSHSAQTVSDLLQTAIRQLKLQWKVVFSSHPTPPNIEKLLWNESFRKWVSKPSQESDAFWHCWRISNPERVADLKLARTVVSALQVRHRQMPEFEQQLLVTQTLAQINVPAQPAPSLLSFFRWQPVSWPSFPVLLASLSKRFRKNKTSLS